MWGGWDDRLGISTPHLIQINCPLPHSPHSWPAIPVTLGVLQEPVAPELKPLERAPVRGYYLLFTVTSSVRRPERVRLSSAEVSCRRPRDRTDGDFSARLRITRCVA
jgi:hypothetical protein